MTKEVYGVPNLNASKELSHFAFLIGKWHGEGITRDEAGNCSGAYRMTWVGRYILDGYVIADEARILDEKGELETHLHYLSLLRLR